MHRLKDFFFAPFFFFFFLFPVFAEIFLSFFIKSCLACSVLQVWINNTSNFSLTDIIFFYSSSLTFNQNLEICMLKLNTLDYCRQKSLLNDNCFLSLLPMFYKCFSSGERALTYSPISDSFTIWCAEIFIDWSLIRNLADLVIRLILIIYWEYHVLYEK